MGIGEDSVGAWPVGSPTQSGGGGEKRKANARCFDRIVQVMAQRWDRYVGMALWISCTAPDTRLPANPSPYQLFFGRKHRIQLDVILPRAEKETGSVPLDSLVDQQRQNLEEIRRFLDERKVQKDAEREARNVRIKRFSAGAKARVGNLILVKEASSSIAGEGLPAKLAHELWTGRWTVTDIVLQGLSFRVTL